MKATGIVRRIDDLGRVVIPKEIRRTMRIREGDPLEIYTSRDGEVIFKKYSLLGGMEDFAAQLCETMSRSTGSICAVTDRDTVIAVAGGGKRELMGKRITPELEQIMENRRIYQYTGEGSAIPVSDGTEKLVTSVAAPILADQVVRGNLRLEGWDGHVLQWINRLTCLRNAMPELELPDFGEEDRLVAITMLCEGAVCYKDIQSRPVLPILGEWLSPWALYGS